MWNGFYNFAFSGEAAVGRNLLALDNGAILSLDNRDLVCSGTYDCDPETGCLDLDLVLIIPLRPCRILDDGLPRGTSDMIGVKITIQGKGMERPKTVRTPLGPLEVKLDRVETLRHTRRIQIPS